MPHGLLGAGAGLPAFALVLAAQQSLPALPDTTGFGVHVLALARAPDQTIWVGTYGRGIFVERPGSSGWDALSAAADSSGRGTFDVVHAFGFAPQGEVWYGTVGHGWGVSTDGGRTWTRWDSGRLGGEWQYVTPNGIVARGDTVYIATTDGIKLSWDHGATWAEITDSLGARTAPRPWGRLRSPYVLALAVGADGSLWASHLRGLARSGDGGRVWTEFPTPLRCGEPACADRVRALAPDSGGVVWVGTEQGLYRLDPARPAWLDRHGRPACAVTTPVRGCRIETPPVAALARAAPGVVYAATSDGVYSGEGNALNVCDLTPSVTALLVLAPGTYAAGRPSGLGVCRVDQGLALVGVTYRERPDTDTQGLRHAWFERPIALTDQPYVDQTDRYGATGSGALAAHRGIAFNNPTGTPVQAIGAGVVVFAGRDEHRSNTLVIRHDRTLSGSFLYSVYRHNAALLAALGQRVRTGEAVALVGNTGGAPSHELELEIHVSPVDSVARIVDPRERDPHSAVNPELWIRPLPGTGVVAGQVWDRLGRAVARARIYGLFKAEPLEAPYSYAETYAEPSAPDPVYREHFAVSDVTPGDYTLAVVLDGRRLTRRVRVAPRQLTWVVFGSRAH